MLPIGLIISSCGSNETKEKEVKETCTFQLDNSADSVKWTAFKFNEKAPVKGTFNNFEVTGISEAKSSKELIESLNIKIGTPSVETANPERNEKISKHFFETIATPEITGSVKKLINENEAEIEITMNGKAQIVKGNYTLSDDLFTFQATIDVLKWDAGKGLEALNKICYDLHKGTDGVSKLWSEVEISFSAPIIKNCQ